MTEKIFINYRRETDFATAGWLHSELETAFTPEGVFRDVDGLRPGTDFVTALPRRVQECDVFLAIIGPGWADVKDCNGGRRLDNPDDWVRIEIESALAKKRYVIPVLVNGAEMPARHSLPDSLASLTRQHAARIRYERFRPDTLGLIEAIKSHREEARAAEERRPKELAETEKREDEQGCQLAEEPAAREQETACLAKAEPFGLIRRQEEFAETEKQAEADERLRPIAKGQELVREVEESQVAAAKALVAEPKGVLLPEKSSKSILIPTGLLALTLICYFASVEIDRAIQLEHVNRVRAAEQAKAAEVERARQLEEEQTRARREAEWRMLIEAEKSKMAERAAAQAAEPVNNNKDDAARVKGNEETKPDSNSREVTEQKEAENRKQFSVSSKADQYEKNHVEYNSITSNPEDLINIGENAYNSKDYERAYNLFYPAAQSGNAIAKAWIGYLLEHGLGIEKDYKKAIRYYQEAANQGSARAQNNLGDLYYYGNGIESDINIAYDFYKNAADQGLADAESNIGMYYQYGDKFKKDISKALYWHRKASKHGSYVAQYRIGNIYMKGIYVKKDSNQAFYWYKKSAEAGYRLAQNRVGLCYDNGEGTKKDHAQAFAWYMKATEQGYASAQFNVGVSYEKGSGVLKDLDKAKEWYWKAAAQGDLDAKKALTDLGVDDEPQL